MKISINNVEIKAEGTAGTSISLNNTTFNASATKPLNNTVKSLDTETFSSGEKAIVEAFINLINSK
jgi:hypothetical protein